MRGTERQAAADSGAGHSRTGLRVATVLRHGSMSLEFYAPRGHAPQTPHEQAELYVVFSGTGESVCQR